MASNIDSTKPIEGTPTTASVRANFATAKSEIESLQNANLLTWTNVTFANGWQNIGGANQTTQYTKMANGMVRIRGCISSGTIGTSAFNLPAGYRPVAANSYVSSGGGVIAQINISTSGDVTPSMGSAASIWLSTVEFDSGS